MEKIAFQTNVPVEVALSHLNGKPSESKFGGTQHFFSTADGRCFYVSETVGVVISEQLRQLGTQPGDFITITKAEVSEGRGKKIRWLVSPVADAREPEPPRRIGPQSVPPPMGERPNGTFAVPALAPKPAPIAQKRAIAPSDAPMWADALLSQTVALIDVYAAAMKHAAQYQGAVKPEAVQSAMITAFIQMAKESSMYGGGA